MQWKPKPSWSDSAVSFRATQHNTTSWTPEKLAAITDPCQPVSTPEASHTSLTPTNVLTMTSQAGEGAVAPVFVRTADVSQRRGSTGSLGGGGVGDEGSEDFMVCRLVAESLGGEPLQGCQKMGQVWYIYPRTEAGRARLLAQGMRVGQRLVDVLDADPTIEVTRVTVKDLPIGLPHAPLAEYLTRQGARLVKGIEYCRILDPNTKQPSAWLNGDRMCVAHKLQRPLPGTAIISGHPVRIFHAGQEPQGKKIVCTNCFQSGHYGNQCRNPSGCRYCRQPQHSKGDQCPAEVKEPLDVTAVQGRKDSLSTMAAGEITVFSTRFPSMEHAYQWAKATHGGTKEIARKVLNAKHPGDAKKEAKGVPWVESWGEKRVVAMRQILEARAQQTPWFKRALLETGSRTIAHTIQGEYYWANGLSREDTPYTLEEYWPGDNMYGKLLMELRDSLTTSDEKPNKRHKKDHGGRRGSGQGLGGSEGDVSGFSASSQSK